MQTDKPNAKGIAGVHADFVRKGLLPRHRIYPGDKAARDAICRQMVKSVYGAENPAEALSVLLPLPPGFRYSGVTPREFVELIGDQGAAAQDSAETAHSRKGRTVLVVDGDLAMGGGAVEWRWLKLKEISGVVVIGNLGISHLPTLRTVDIDCLGDLSIEGCANLNCVRGEVFGSAGLTGCGVRSLGADFRCAGDLFLAGCGSLGKLNCEVGGDLSVTACGLECTGPAFTVGGSGRFFSCGSLTKMAGRINGKVQLIGTPERLDCTELNALGMQEREWRLAEVA